MTVASLLRCAVPLADSSAASSVPSHRALVFRSISALSSTDGLDPSGLMNGSSRSVPLISKIPCGGVRKHSAWYSRVSAIYNYFARIVHLLTSV